MVTYQIYELSARAVMSYAAEQDGVYTFALNRSATEHCKVPGARHDQDSCAMFHQLMYQLHGKGWRERGEEKVTALSDVLFYMDFAGIFDRRGTGRTQQARREKARDMFRPEGITLDFGSGPHRYVAFERSASMSRQSRLSFIRADLYEPMRQRIMLNMELDRCQLSKLYAYNGLMFSSGTRVEPRAWSERQSSPFGKAESREPSTGQIHWKIWTSPALTAWASSPKSTPR